LAYNIPDQLVPQHSFDRIFCNLKDKDNLESW